MATDGISYSRGILATDGISYSRGILATDGISYSRGILATVYTTGLYVVPFRTYNNS
ncbi:MAG: hypothetical protein SOV16_10565 [Anaerobiospirillum succiniciproducens]|uniref:hypothetical protein n=1 Tax=Anaerobiospirillum succiniciproducens TaxID=13335 RepID=UPI002A765CED|nr:hypothetical protein [Anaerobiospirillum succiniciproducens]MDY2799582.1 hypothetical protein [Anaerobiospirillum succiniciproducens]